MEIFREIVGLLVIIIGPLGAVVFLPQIRVLYKVKKAESFSLLTLWVSFVMQAVILVHVLIQPVIDWRLSVTYFTAIACFIVFLVFIYYYRRWPGGRDRHETKRG